MPVTPYHFGPGLTIKSVLLKRFSFKAFILANILTDIEPVYFLCTQQLPLHRFFHTYLGATLLAVFCMVVVRMVWTKSSRAAVAAGAFLGTYSHVFLDSFMHTDMQPFFPWTRTNPFLGIFSAYDLEVFCLACWLLGAVVYFIRLEWGHQKP
jgi:membrane-bound metal-dependent hydrolase YbcI (DUF457 family)